MNRIDKIQQLNLSLADKEQRTKELILEWYLQYDGNVYVSFSGGKDSTVLLHIARSLKTCKDIKGVFFDTGLEYPEIREFVKKQENIDWIKPKMTFKKVIEKYGWPVISKENSKKIYEIRNTKSEYVRNLRLHGSEKGQMAKLPEMFKPMLDSPFKISSACCSVMKKRPAHKYEKETGKKPIIGVMAEESRQRTSQYFLGNCNEFSKNRPISRPLMFWTEQDVLQYIVKNNLEIAPIYGDIVEVKGKLRTTGAHRTGCMFCMYGCHLESQPGRFDRMKVQHPKQYDYIMNTLGGQEVYDLYMKCAGKCQLNLMLEKKQ